MASSFRGTKQLGCAALFILSIAAGARAQSAPAYNGTREYSLSVTATRLQHGKDKEATWKPMEAYPTRVMEQLAKFSAKPVATDKWGCRMDRAGAATGFFYTKKIGDRWWAIDPEGRACFHQAVVAVAPGSSARAVKARERMFGNKAAWMAKTHALLLENGFHGTGGWSDADQIRRSPLEAAHPLAYTVSMNVMSSYGKVRGGLRTVPGHAGYPNDVIFVFDPGFERFADGYVKKSVAAYASDPALFGYFSDNEMPLDRNNLDRYLELPHDDPGYRAAKEWMDKHQASQPSNELREQFLGYEVDRYASIVKAALHKYDPNHMYLGCRFVTRTQREPAAFAALGKYADAISVNYYGTWTPDLAQMKEWEQAAGKPILITEFYVKGMDSGLPNTTGAGWTVATQADRGAFYQNYVLALIESKVVVGWHWFKYQDNDPDDPNAELSNRDANKGIVNIDYRPYAPLLERMRQLNLNSYALADYFDAR